MNDVIVTGAQPLFFLDYFATSKLDVDQAADVIQGIVDGCKLADCQLMGGETAEVREPYIYIYIYIYTTYHVSRRRQDSTLLVALALLLQFFSLYIHIL